MDAAETWLFQHDPAYNTTCQTWKHVRTGEYRGPREEIPAGDTVDLEAIVMDGGRLVEHRYSEDKACEVCTYTFTPREAAQRFCGDVCRRSARRAYQRDLMRARRLEAASARPKDASQASPLGVRRAA